MLTLNRLLEHFCEAGKLEFVGNHYQSNEPVYTGDLWRLWPDPEGKGLESKNQNRLSRAMESKGMQLRFYDEIITDSDGKAHEENPGYYGQVPTWKILGCEVWSRENARADIPAYIDALLGEDGPISDRWLEDEDFEANGFTLFAYDAETGFHHGQDDTPEKVIERFKGGPGISRDDWQFIFQITDVGQFDCHYRMWFRPETWEEEQGA